mgnify:FL=1
MLYISGVPIERHANLTVQNFWSAKYFCFLENQLQLVLYLIGNFCINENVLGQWWYFKILIFFEKNLYAYWWVRQLSFETPFWSYHEKRPSQYSCVSVYLTTAVTLCLTVLGSYIPSCLTVEQNILQIRPYVSISEFLIHSLSLSLIMVAIFQTC